MQLIQFFLILLIGAVCGFLSSAPLGPMNLWLANLTLAKQHGRARPFVAGVILVDTIYAGVAAYGQSERLFQWIAKDVLNFGAGVFLILLGGAQLFRRTEQALPSTKIKPETGVFFPLRDFLTGAIMCGSNPAFFMFWLFVTNWLSSMLQQSFSLIAVGTFLAGVVLGDLVWFSFMLKLAQRGMEYLNQSRTVILRKGIAWSFIALGFFAIKRGLFS